MRGCPQFFEHIAGIKSFFLSSASPPIDPTLGGKQLRCPLSPPLQHVALLSKPLKSNELSVPTRPSLQPLPHVREGCNNCLFLCRKEALTRPSLQLRFLAGACAPSGECGFFPHTPDGVTSSFASTPDCESARPVGSLFYWPDNQDRWQVFAFARRTFWRVGMQPCRNNAGFLCAGLEQTDSRSGRTEPCSWFLSSRNHNRTALTQNPLRLWRRNPKEEPKEVEQFGRKRTSHARRKVIGKELGWLLNRKAGLLFHQSKWPAFTPAPI